MKMVAAVSISSGLLAALVADCAATPALERCGLLFGREGMIDHVASAPNVAATPANSFEIDPAMLVAAHRAARGGGPQVIGHYHSHPTGRAWPSTRDALSAGGDGQLWLIVAGEEANLFRATAGGPVAGAFEALLLRVTA
ncbi:proteasome lid subunit RPN8/RPN11 [Sphingomonas jejuensis]|uniref:Proteasome lid subunit RPN8/RPN11 n=1 Tax=Sphingomonas jejuensis TaxID=904715 RepID=A0ABX0XJZ7_9SPHN|nr:proteasome lid subunit RPN8/RPN11 [Sphingomonas jejuensis]